MKYMTNNLIKRGHSWSVRYVIPTAYRAKVGKSEIVRALGTRDLDEARKLKHSILAEIIQEVDAIINPGNLLVREAKAVALDLATADGDGGFVEVMDQQGITHLIMESKADLLTSVAIDHVEVIARTHGDAIGQQYAAIALNGSMPISLAGEEWLDKLEGKVTQGTIDGRRRAINEFISDMGDMPISMIAPRMATTWLTDYLEPSGRMSATLGRYIGTMELLWKWSYRREWCSGLSPFNGLTSELKKTKSIKRGFKDSELRLFIDGLSARRNKRPEEYDVGVLLMESSTRLNEIAELRVRHIKDNGEVHIVDGKNKSANRCIFFFSDRAKAILEKRTVGKAPDDQLFHELKPGGQDQKLGHSLSKRMRATLAEVIPDAKAMGLDLHSIRRWGATVWENLDGVDRTLMNRSFGHNVGDLMGDRYSDGPEKDRLIKAFKTFYDSVVRRVP